MGREQMSNHGDVSFEQLELAQLTVTVRDAAKGGFKGQYRADRAECERLGSLIDLGEITEFQADYQIEPSKSGRFRMTAQLRGRISQNCVASLKVLDNDIEEEFTVLFVSERRFAEIINESQLDPESDDDFEPYGDGTLKVGRVIYEHLVGAIDPYPRADDGEFDRDIGGLPDHEDEVEGPFSVLADLRKDVPKS